MATGRICPFRSVIRSAMAVPSVAVMLMGLAIWLGANALRAVLDAEARLEKKRRRTEAKALNNWQRLYDEERKNHNADVSDLIDELDEAKKENKRLKDIMAKVKVSEL